MASVYSYCTATQVKEVLKPLADLSAWDDLEIELRISDAESEINSQLISRFSIPFTGTKPELIVLIAKFLAGARILDDINAEESPREPEGFSKKLKDKANEIIKKILEGIYTLLDSSGIAITGESLIKSHTEENDLDPFFGTDEFGQYEEENAR